MNRHIDYAPALPRYRRKWVRRALALILVAALLAPIAWKAGPPAWRHTELLYWQRQAMRYSPSANEVVYYASTNDTAVLQGRPDNTYRVLWKGKSDYDLYRMARPWERFYDLFSPPGREPAATAFLHQRRTALGTPRMIAVEVEGEFWFQHDVLQVSTNVFRAGTLASRPTELSSSTSSVELGAISYPSAGVYIRIYAGQIDPDDASHFTINYWLQGNTGTIDGWLEDDDTVKIEPRR